MNIIFYRYRSICEPDFIEAFKAIGLKVIEDTDGMKSEISLEKKMNNLGNIVAWNTPLFVFSINFYPFISILCERLHVFYIAVTVDCPVFEIFNTSIRNKFNRIFLFDKEQYNMIRDENPDCIFHMPLGAACERVSKFLGATSDYRYDISFVGSLYNEKDPLQTKDSVSEAAFDKINKAIERQLEGKVYGYEHIMDTVDNCEIEAIKEAYSDFYPSDMSITDISKYVAVSNYVSPHMTYIERVRVLNLLAKNATGSVHLFTSSNTKELSPKVKVHGGVDSLKEMPFVFRQSKINLNITTRSITSGLSQRIWDVLACRGFLITNYQPEIDDYFKDGEHLVTYKSYDELAEKVRYYLAHDKERETIAQNGFEYVNKNGKVVDRAVEIIRTVVMP